MGCLHFLHFGGWYFIEVLRELDVHRPVPLADMTTVLNQVFDECLLEGVLQLQFGIERRYPRPIS